MTLNDQRPSSSPYRIAIAKADHSLWVKRSTGPAGSFEFLTSTKSSAKATSTQLESPQYEPRCQAVLSAMSGSSKMIASSE
jgi:hypothetical protein